MKYTSRKQLAATAAIAMVCASTNTMAQSVSGEESLAVGVEVQVAAAGATVLGLEDIAIQYDGTRGAGAIYESSQLFCIYSPTRYIDMNVAGSQKGDKSNQFYVVDSTPVSPTAQAMTYDLFFEEAVSGNNVPLGTGTKGMVQNNVPTTGIDFGIYRTGQTCSDGENVKLTLKMIFDGGGTANPNAAVTAQLVDGQIHKFNDTVTITVTPAI